jgi:hypothetical protein
VNASYSTAPPASANAIARTNERVSLTIVQGNRKSQQPVPRHVDAAAWGGLNRFLARADRDSPRKRALTAGGQGALTTKKKPRRSGCQTGASSLGTWLRGINPYRVILSKLRGLQRVLLTTTAMQNRRAKTRSPERGLVSRGHTGSINSGIIVWDVSTTRCVNKGDNSRILARCDIGATEKGGKTWSADRSRCLSRPCR